MLNEFGMKLEENGKDDREVQVQCPIQCVQKERNMISTVCSAEKIMNVLQSDRSRMNESTLLGYDLRNEVRFRKLFSKINRSTHICNIYLRKAKKIFRKWKINQSTCFYDIHTLKNFDPENCFPRSTDQPIFATHTSEKGKKSSENGRSTSQPAFTTYTH